MARGITPRRPGRTGRHEGIGKFAAGNRVALLRTKPDRAAPVARKPGGQETL